MPPDFSKDPVWSPECILPQARTRKAENECFPPQVARTYWTCRSLQGSWQGLLRVAWAKVEVLKLREDPTLPI